MSKCGYWKAYCPNSKNNGGQALISFELLVSLDSGRCISNSQCPQLIICLFLVRTFWYIVPHYHDGFVPDLFLFAMTSCIVCYFQRLFWRPWDGTMKLCILTLSLHGEIHITRRWQIFKEILLPHICIIIFYTTTAGARLTKFKTTYQPLGSINSLCH